MSTGEKKVARKRKEKEMPPKGMEAHVPDSIEDRAQTAFTTLRVFAEDGEDLSQLADMWEVKGMTVAKLYKELLRPVVRKALSARLRERLQGLDETECS